MTTSWPTTMRWIVLAFGLLPGMIAAGEHRMSCESLTCLADLKKLTECDLDQVFAGAGAGEIPVGFAKGRVLILVDARLPRVKARLAGAAWKGKCFEEDGHFINQWPGFRALESQACHGPSWFDGQPCIVMEYPAGTPLFGNVRDEIRQIGPCLYLGRLYERCPCPKFLGYFALEMKQ